MPHGRNRSGAGAGGYSIRNWVPPQKGEYHVPLANFLGPGTQIKARIQNNVQPTTNADALARTHDVAYSQIGTKLKKKQLSPLAAVAAMREADMALKKGCQANLKTRGPIEKMHAAVGATGMIAKAAAEELGIMSELKFIDPDEAYDEEIGGGKKKKQKKKDRVKKLRKLLKKK